MKPGIVFMGSPDFAVPILETLASNYSIVGVVTQPDRPAGRGHRLTPPPLKAAAIQLELPVIQPERLRQPEAMEQLRRWNPELIVVAAFGQILRPDVLGLPQFGCLNIHASLLPRWRGAAPVPAAILNGDDETGVSLMLMDAGVDTGPLISQKSTPILPSETAGSLLQRLSFMGAELLLESLPGYLQGRLPPIPQDHSQATKAPMLAKKDGLLDFSLSAVELVRRVRAFNPWPGTYTFWNGEILKVHRASSTAQDQFFHSLLPGTHVIQDGFPAITTAEGTLVLEEVQPAGKKTIPGKIFLLGARNWGHENHDGG
ncbi:MAG: methionyl-tRNA formyltransferase [Chloroflexi bacterium RBG_16_54_18]|nr:MAG: methionyl-tRNA formyltransferase [Chloroflexi bacterium RBG_16_54_18]